MTELSLEDWLPMPPDMGPPLPRILVIYWPWYEEKPPGTLRLTVFRVGNGTVTPGSGDYEAGATVTLTAVPDTGAVFDHWSGDASGTSPTIDILMDRDKEVTAHFVESVEPEPEPEPTPTTEGTLSGTVKCSATGTPLEDAYVETLATFTIINKYGVEERPGSAGHTDEAGQYQFLLITGKYIIKARKTGYESVEGVVTISEGSNTLDIHLAPVVPPNRYALDGGVAMSWQEGGSWKSMTLNYSSQPGYSGIKIFFKAYRLGVQYSLDYVDGYTYRITQVGTATITKTLPRSPYPGGGVDYYMSIRNNVYLKDLRVKVYLSTPEGGWKHVNTLGRDYPY